MKKKIRILNILNFNFNSYLTFKILIKVFQYYTLNSVYSYAFMINIMYVNTQVSMYEIVDVFVNISMYNVMKKKSSHINIYPQQD